MVKAIPEGLKTGRIDTDLFVERNNTGTGDGKVSLRGRLRPRRRALHPDAPTGRIHRASASRLASCRSAEELAEAELELADSPLEATGHGAASRSVGPNENHLRRGLLSTRTLRSTCPLTNIDSPVRLTVVSSDGKIEAWVNDVLVESSVNVGQIDIYGFVSQTYHRPRSHIHFDDLLISA